MKKLSLLLLGILIGAVPTVFAATILFSDISEDDWYYSAVISLQEKGIIEGYDDGTYKPSSNVNRAEIAIMLDRLIDYIENGSATDATTIKISDSIPDESDNFSFGNEVYNDATFQDGDTLYINVGYGGGCEDHDFDLMWDGSFEDSSHAALYLIHEDYGDACEAYISQTLKYDIGSIREEYTETYKSSEGDLFITIYGSGDNSELIEYIF